MNLEEQKRYIKHLLRVIYESETPSDRDKKVLKYMSELDCARDFDSTAQYNRLMRSVSKVRHKPKVRWQPARRVAVYMAAAALAVLVCTVGIRIFGSRPQAIQSVDLSAQARPILRMTTEQTDPYRLMLELSDGRRWCIDDQDGPVDVAGIQQEIREAGAGKDLTASIVVPKTRIASFAFTDGSLIALNSDSRLSFPISYGAGERKVSLEYGEAFLKVAKDRDHPFAVELPNAEINVLGTEFNVSASGETSVTTLVNGKIELTKSSRTDRVVMTPGEEAIVTLQGIEVGEVDTSDVGLWQEGKYAFRSQPLTDILGQVSRWYDVHFVVSDPSIARQTFTGVIYKRYAIDFVLKLLEETAGVVMTREGERTVRVERK